MGALLHKKTFHIPYYALLVIQVDGACVATVEDSFSVGCQVKGIFDLNAHFIAERLMRRICFQFHQHTVLINGDNSVSCTLPFVRSFRVPVNR